MTEWSVAIEGSHAASSLEEAGEALEQILEDLEDYSPAGSYGPDRISLVLTVDAADVGKAFQRGLDLFDDIVGRALPEPRFLSVQLQTMEQLARSLEEPNFPELVGVAEVAEILRVSRQRVSELARSRGFPRPVAHLASGPVWTRAAIERHVGRWPRRPGRPRLNVSEQDRDILDQITRLVHEGLSLREVADELKVEPDVLATRLEDLVVNLHGSQADVVDELLDR